MSITQTIRAMIGCAVPATDGAFVAPPAALPPELESQHHAALIDHAREQLRAAHVARAAAQGLLAEAESKVARAISVIEESRRLDSEARQAEAVAREAAKNWTAAGCPETGRPDPDLLDRAAKASSAAIDGRTIAAGAQDALPDLKRAAQSARIDLSQSDEAVRDAAVGVLIASAEPRLAELERLRDGYEAALRPVASLRHLVRQWGPAAALEGFSNSYAGEMLAARVKELAPLPPADADLFGSASDLRERALRLIQDPDAVLSL